MYDLTVWHRGLSEASNYYSLPDITLTVYNNAGALAVLSDSLTGLLLKVEQILLPVDAYLPDWHPGASGWWPRWK